MEWALEPGALPCCAPMEQLCCLFVSPSGQTKLKTAQEKTLLGVHTALEAKEGPPVSREQVLCDHRASWSTDPSSSFSAGEAGTEPGAACPSRPTCPPPPPRARAHLTSAASPQGQLHRTCSVARSLGAQLPGRLPLLLAWGIAGAAL